MNVIAMNEALFHGAVSVEITEDGARPWRIPYREAALFPPDGIGGEAKVPAGVRISFWSDSSSIQVSFAATENPLSFDCLVDGQFHSTRTAEPGESVVSWDALPGTNKSIEIYLSPKHPVCVQRILLDQDSSFTYFQDKRPRWIAYGSSITQCKAASPSQTWPALVAQSSGLQLTCLGYSANCHLEPMVARMIRDLPADIISLCLGINVMGQSSLNARTFKSSVIGLIQIIRERHQGTPLLLMSPIFAPERETADNPVGLNLVKIRQELREAYEILREHGDRHLFYVEGLDIFGESDQERLSDKLHPDAEGYTLIARRVHRLFQDELKLHSLISEGNERI
ncbi:GDSL family lipase [Paenibacillus ihbetae]|uniref:GDSL family lipase n=1 Tax=Paenibacillus ihbetae TaxID=1870820 RepID=A0A1B2E0A6_9BACL|nr:SGNH/GDSL hydrolase family protein [Paenibacillus ihbetae]ANY73385.1 GDSL family lipase [Paenibacillus ihbetae]